MLIFKARESLPKTFSSFLLGEQNANRWIYEAIFC